MTVPTSHEPTTTAEDPDARMERALRDYLAAVDETVETTRAFAVAPPHEKLAAHARLLDALRRQADAERAHERARQVARRVPYVGRPRMTRY